MIVSCSIDSIRLGHETKAQAVNVNVHWEREAKVNLPKRRGNVDDEVACSRLLFRGVNSFQVCRCLPVETMERLLLFEALYLLHIFSCLNLMSKRLTIMCLHVEHVCFLFLIPRSWGEPSFEASNSDWMGNRRHEYLCPTLNIDLLNIKPLLPKKTLPCLHASVVVAKHAFFTQATNIHFSFTRENLQTNLSFQKCLTIRI